MYNGLKFIEAIISKIYFLFQETSFSPGYVLYSTIHVVFLNVIRIFSSLPCMDPGVIRCSSLFSVAQTSIAISESKTRFIFLHSCLCCSHTTLNSLEICRFASRTKILISSTQRWKCSFTLNIRSS